MRNSSIKRIGRKGKERTKASRRTKRTTLEKPRTDIFGKKSASNLFLLGKALL